tara:strand:+ start:188 stop:400 length:213 start_codon:yes stop_codon:yes gene_type:complete
MRLGSKPSTGEYMTQLRNFYEKHAPEKLSGGDLKLEALITKWNGREERLFHVLYEKYVEESYFSPGKQEL